MSYLIGFGILILFLIAYRFFSRTWDVFKLAEGADGKISSSKFQWLVWTIVALFSYAAIFAARIKFGIYATTLSIPPHLLISMGLSTSTMAAAKGITVLYLAKGHITKTPAAKGGTHGIAPLFNDDDGIPDLSKIQMLAWTFIAIIAYLFQLHHQIHMCSPASPGSLAIPDIDTTLMALMGFGQAGYLGKKAVATG